MPIIRLNKQKYLFNLLVIRTGLGLPDTSPWHQGLGPRPKHWLRVLWLTDRATAKGKGSEGWRQTAREGPGFQKPPSEPWGDPTTHLAMSPTQPSWSRKPCIRR